MPLFQNKPITPEQIELSKPLELSPEEVVKLDDAEWYRRAYRGDDAPQLTLRAVVMGVVLGFLLAFTNVYIGLKAGWHLGVVLTASIVSFSVWGFLLRIRVAKTPMAILENNCMQSTASAAGYATGSTMVSAIPALLLLTVTADNPGGRHLPWPTLTAWTFFLGVLGVMMAIPMKRNMINQEKLRFPTGTAAAVTLQSLYSQGAEALVKGRALFIAMAVSGVIPLLKDLNLLHEVNAAGKIVRAALLPGYLKMFDWLPSIKAAGKSFLPSDWNIKFDYGPALIGAGALAGLRVTASMILGGLFLILFLGPAGLEATWTNPLGAVVTAVNRPSTAWREIGLWLGAPMMVSGGLVSFALQWRTIARAFRGILRGTGGQGKAENDRIEVPLSWFVVGALLASVGVIAIAQMAFGIPFYFGILAVIMTFALCLVACRATGESDITPTGPMGKIMQLTYGVLIPQNATANLMSAGITAGAAAASADLLSDLKSGHLLGANPRRQFVAQLIGVLPGTVATVACFYILVPNATVLTGANGADPQFTAPAAQQWKAVAQVFQLGFENLHPMARQCVVAGLIAGTLLALLERALPRQKSYIPSATGIGLGLLLPFYQPLQMFTGALFAAILETWREGRYKGLVVPLASGFIAGEGIIGVVVAALNNFVLK